MREAFSGLEQPPAGRSHDYRRRSRILDALQDRRDLCRRTRRRRRRRLRHLGDEDRPAPESSRSMCAMRRPACAARPTCSAPGRTARSSPWSTRTTRRCARSPSRGRPRTGAGCCRISACRTCRRGCRSCSAASPIRSRSPRPWPSGTRSISRRPSTRRACAAAWCARTTSGSRIRTARCSPPSRSSRSSRSARAIPSRCRRAAVP